MALASRSIAPLLESLGLSSRVTCISGVSGADVGLYTGFAGSIGVGLIVNNPSSGLPICSISTGTTSSGTTNDADSTIYESVDKACIEFNKLKATTGMHRGGLLKSWAR